MSKQGETGRQPGKARPPESGGIVLVGTFRPENAGWIKGRKLYNLPLPAEGATAFHRSVSRVVLVAEGEGTLAYAARFEREVDGAELAALGYRAAARGAAHGGRYALYRLGAKLSPTRALRAADVFVSSSRCPKVRIDAGFYGRPYPKTGGRSMPHVFDALKPHFGKWRSAVTFDPAREDLFKELGMADVPFPGIRNPRFTFIDLFAGIGGFHLAMEQLGGKCVFASEWDKDAQDTYERNYGIRPKGDIKKIDEADIPHHDVLCAGFPCQPFSKAGQQKGFEDETLTRRCAI